MTTKAFLAYFGFDTLRDLPDMEKLEDAGLLNKEKLLADISDALDVRGDEALVESATSHDATGVWRRRRSRACH